MNFGTRIGALAMAAGSCVGAQAAVTTIPQSALVPSTTLWTTDVGTSTGSVLVMTGGGNAANVGNPSGRNDDGFSGPISFGPGFTFTLFGSSYTSFYANNNGNISFGSGIAAFTPTGLQGATEPIISPFFADVDTRNASSGVMMLQRHSSARGDEVIVTWPAVGFFNTNGTPLDTFQLVVRDDDYDIPAGEGQVGFFWNAMGWEVGEASGGTSAGVCPGAGGLGTACVPAAIGFGDGLSNGFVLQGSTQNGIAGVVANHRLWVNLDDRGVPVVPGIPEPGTLLLSGAAMLALGVRRRRSR